MQARRDLAQPQATSILLITVGEVAPKPGCVWAARITLPREQGRGAEAHHGRPPLPGPLSTAEMLTGSQDFTGVC